MKPEKTRTVELVVRVPEVVYASLLNISKTFETRVEKLKQLLFNMRTSLPGNPVPAYLISILSAFRFVIRAVIEREELINEVKADLKSNREAHVPKDFLHPVNAGVFPRYFRGKKWGPSDTAFIVFRDATDPGVYVMKDGTEIPNRPSATTPLWKDIVSIVGQGSWFELTEREALELLKPKSKSKDGLSPNSLHTDEPLTLESFLESCIDLDPLCIFISVPSTVPSNFLQRLEEELLRSYHENKPELKIEEGEQYILRDGTVTQPLRNCNRKRQVFSTVLPFKDTLSDKICYCDVYFEDDGKAYSPIYSPSKDEGRPVDKFGCFRREEWDIVAHYNEG